ncbi:MAG: hypothetical protein WCO58_00575 [bacterium]
MHHLFEFTSLVGSHQFFTYAVIVLGIIIEGDVIVLVAGALSHLGAISVPVTLAVIILGGIAKLFLGYGIGSLLVRKFGAHRFFMVIKKRIDYFLPRFERKPFWSIFAARFFTLGLHMFTLIFSGYSKIPFKKVLKADFSSLFVWAFGLFGIGYFFSYTAMNISHDFRKIIIFVLLFIVLFIIVQRLLISLAKAIAEWRNNE